MKILTESEYHDLLTSGHVVPRNPKTGEVRTDFKVSREYLIKYAKNEPRKVRCTQNCPTCIKLI